MVYMDLADSLHTLSTVFHTVLTGSHCWMVGLAHMQAQHVLGLCFLGCVIAGTLGRHFLFPDASLPLVSDIIMVLFHVVHQTLALKKSMVVVLAAVHADDRWTLYMMYVEMIPVLVTSVVPLMFLHDSA